MATDADARKAIRTMNGTVLDGRPINVREDNIKMSKFDYDTIKKFGPDRNVRGKERSRSGSLDYSPSESRSPRNRSRSRSRERYRAAKTGFKIEVRNLPADIKQHQLVDLFKEFGQMTSCNLTGVDSNGMKFGQIVFEQVRDADRATRTINNTIFGGMKLTVIKEY
eukprot:TRINITY_DN701_c0_g1_i1.p1 TRINITY_DN701_c0_g1~~TRINITY_DN701_c0_g1_i1.p1  ORF type:complete len:166 (+),score=25.14 TRINITY_DN701_c0_g1_i1:511-1008(+)